MSHLAQKFLRFGGPGRLQPLLQPPKNGPRNPKNGPRINKKDPPVEDLRNLRHPVLQVQMEFRGVAISSGFGLRKRAKNAMEKQALLLSNFCSFRQARLLSHDMVSLQLGHVKSRVAQKDAKKTLFFQKIPLAKNFASQMLQTKAWPEVFHFLRLRPTFLRLVVHLRVRI